MRNNNFRNCDVWIGVEELLFSVLCHWGETFMNKKLNRSFQKFRRVTGVKPYRNDHDVLKHNPRELFPSEAHKKVFPSSGESFLCKSVKWCRTLSFTWYILWQLLLPPESSWTRANAHASWIGNEAVIYYVSLFNLTRADGMQHFWFSADARRFEALEWQWLERKLSVIFHFFPRFLLT